MAPVSRNKTKERRVPPRCRNAVASKKLKKAPEAPRRFKSAYMFFSVYKHKEFRDAMEQEGNAKGTGGRTTTPEIAKKISKIWKAMSEEERSCWKEMEQKDKARFEMESSMYDGPWIVNRKNDDTNPNQPKRPMSAFLLFSQAKRTAVKQEFPGLPASDISKILADMWKETPPEESKIYRDHASLLIENYKKEKEKLDKEYLTIRMAREEIAWNRVKQKAFSQNQISNMNDDTENTANHGVQQIKNCVSPAAPAAAIATTRIQVVPLSHIHKNNTAAATYEWNSFPPPPPPPPPVAPNHVGLRRGHDDDHLSEIPVDRLAATNTTIVGPTGYYPIRRRIEPPPLQNCRYSMQEPTRPFLDKPIDPLMMYHPQPPSQNQPRVFYRNENGDFEQHHLPLLSQHRHRHHHLHPQQQLQLQLQMDLEQQQHPMMMTREVYFQRRQQQQQLLREKREAVGEPRVVEQTCWRTFHHHHQANDDTDHHHANEMVPSAPISLRPCTSESVLETQAAALSPPPQEHSSNNNNNNHPNDPPSASGNAKVENRNIDHCPGGEEEEEEEGSDVDTVPTTNRSSSVVVNGAPEEPFLKLVPRTPEQPQRANHNSLCDLFLDQVKNEQIRDCFQFHSLSAKYGKQKANDNKKDQPMG